MSTSRNKSVVIGLGNPLMGDDGLGIAAVERLRARWEVPSEVELVDGGTWGMNLLPLIEDADQVLLIDAITAGSEPGVRVVVPRARLPRYLATKISPHQVDLRDVLALAELRGTLPEETVAIGLEPAGIEFGKELSDEVRGHLDDLVDAVVHQLESWGHACASRTAPAHA